MRPLRLRSVLGEQIATTEMISLTCMSSISLFGGGNVDELTRRFCVEKNGRFPIRLSPLNLDQILEEIKSTIVMEPDDVEIEHGDLCDGHG